MITNTESGSHPSSNLVILSVDSSNFFDTPELESNDDESEILFTAIPDELLQKFSRINVPYSTLCSFNDLNTFLGDWNGTNSIQIEIDPVNLIETDVLTHQFSQKSKLYYATSNNNVDSLETSVDATNNNMTCDLGNELEQRKIISSSSDLHTCRSFENFDMLKSDADLLMTSDPIVMGDPSSFIDLASPHKTKISKGSKNLFDISSSSNTPLHSSSSITSTPISRKISVPKCASVRKHCLNTLKESVRWNHIISDFRKRAKSEFKCQKMQDSENGTVTQLPCFDSLRDAIKRIDCDTLICVLEGKYGEFYDDVIIVDCRYPYEYNGGHIPTAININTTEQADSYLFSTPSIHRHVLLIFHCEFSSERAPRMALHVRNQDRLKNNLAYPSLYYPEMYILDGGYKQFYEKFPLRCDPPHSYLPMRNPQYRDQLILHQKTKKSGTKRKSRKVLAKNFFQSLLASSQNQSRPDYIDEDDEHDLEPIQSRTAPFGNENDIDDKFV